MGVFLEYRQESLPLLRDALESQLPKSLAVYGFVDNLIRYDLKELGTRVIVATETSFGTFVVLTPTCTWEGAQSVMLYHDIDFPGDEDESADEEFATLLESVPGLDWTKAVYLYGCSMSVSKRIRRLMNSRRLMTDPRYHSVSQAHAFVLASKDDDNVPQQEIRVAEGYTLSSLSPAHADWIYDRWNLNFSETRSAMRTIFLSNLPTVAAFEKDAAEIGVRNLPKESLPVSWILRYPNGALGNTFTLPEHRRKNLARTVTLALAKEVDALGSPVFVYVDDENVGSIAFHIKMGFEKACPFVWEVYMPSDDNLEELSSCRAT